MDKAPSISTHYKIKCMNVSKYVKDWFVVMVALSCFAWLGSCSDDVDDSNLYSFTGEVISSYLDKNPEFSDYVSILKRVKLSNKAETSLYDLLSTRGNYTVFAPSNEAIHHYVDSLMGQTDFPLEELTDSLAALIARNSVIDSGSDEAYQTITFNEGALSRTNMNERYITVDFDTLAGQVSYIINSSSRIIVPDIETENGYVQVVNSVVASSMAILPSLVETIPNLKIFSRLLQETGWDQELQAYLDADYEAYHPESGKSISSTDPNIHTPPHRKTGFTLLVETDSVFQEKWGITPVLSANGTIENWDEVKRVFDERCSQMSIYHETSTANGSPADWKNPYNVVNQFVGYHILNQSVPYNLLVIHYNEMYFSYKNPTKYTLNITENYETLGVGRRILRITEGPTTDGKRINRCSKYDRNTYDELTVASPGILLSPDNYTGGKRYVISALNGFYYPIDDILEYNKYVRDVVCNDRMRWDIQHWTREAASNDFLNPYVGNRWSIPNNYLESFVHVSDESWIVYLNEMSTGSARNWRAYMGTEYHIMGVYDVTLLIPPVPFDGTYEVRYGMSSNIFRGMAQVYFGDDPDNLPATGLPVDMRLTAQNPQIGWVADDENDPTVAIENDRAMRNRGYMKAPQIFGFTNANGVSTSARSTGSLSESAYRKILWRGDLKAGKKYYVRFKSVLASNYGQFDMDYWELVPKSIYDGAVAEDIW